MKTKTQSVKSRRRASVVVAFIVATVGIFSLGVLTALGTPVTPDLSAGGSQAVIALDVQPVEGSDGMLYALTLGVMPRGEAELSLRFTSGQMYDFVVFQDGREVWRWSAGRVFHQALHTRTIEPGTLQTFVELWDGRDAQGEPVVGDVTIRASVKTAPDVGPVAEAEPVTIYVGDNAG